MKMTFEELLDQALDMRRRRGRVTYGALKRQFALDDAYAADLKDAMLLGVTPHDTPRYAPGGTR
jgi:hypothetical protein